jgi:hypothetical protein
MPAPHTRTISDIQKQGNDDHQCTKQMVVKVLLENAELNQTTNNEIHSLPSIEPAITASSVCVVAFVTAICLRLRRSKWRSNSGAASGAVERWAFRTWIQRAARAIQNTAPASSF